MTDEELGPLRRELGRFERTKGKYNYAWGYDRPIGEYFYEKFDMTKKENDCVFAIGTAITTNPHPDFPEKLVYSYEEMAELMEEDGVVPKQFIQKLK